MEILQSRDKQNRSMVNHRLFLQIPMNLHVNHKIDRFCIAGISYRKAEFSVRGRFSLNEAAKVAILSEAAELGLKSALVISTCNRTEIYGYASNPQIFGALLVKHSVGGTKKELQAYGYFHQGLDALKHAFRVGAGLDSQIVGDFEISGQMKQALAFSQKRKMIGPILDRTFNFIAQASKKIKNQTDLSSGTVSVSFAAIEWLQEKLKNENAKILVVGAGKFGVNVVKNLLHYIPAVQLTICNRTPDKAIDMANSFTLGILPIESLQAEAKNYDVIITCTNAQLPLIYADYLISNKKYLLIDLSVPANIDERVIKLPFVELVNVDDISVLLRKTICRRMADVPKAETIIDDHIELFCNWLNTYRHTPLVNELKLKLIQYSEACNNTSTNTSIHNIGENSGDYGENIRAIVTNLMVNLKTRREKGCQIIAAYHDFFNMSKNIGLP